MSWTVNISQRVIHLCSTSRIWIKEQHGGYRNHNYRQHQQSWRHWHLYSQGENCQGASEHEGILLAVEGEDVFLVSSDQQDWRSQITWQEVQPRQVESAGTHSSPPDRHGAARRHTQPAGDVIVLSVFMQSGLKMWVRGVVQLACHVITQSLPVLWLAYLLIKWRSHNLDTRPTVLTQQWEQLPWSNPAGPHSDGSDGETEAHRERLQFQS